MKKLFVAIVIALPGQFAHAQVKTGVKQCDIVFSAMTECMRELRDTAREMGRQKDAADMAAQVSQLEVAADGIRAKVQSDPAARQRAIQHCNELSADPNTQSQLQGMLTNLTMLRMARGGAKRCEVAYARYKTGR